MITRRLAAEVSDTLLPGKATKLQLQRPYRKPTLVREMSILRRLRELGEGTRQIDTVTSEEGVPLVGEPSRMEPNEVAENRWLRLFNKNTALCKHESGRIGCDACPVLED